MKPIRIVKSLMMWLVFLITAILNGILREEFITPNIGEQAGHIISTIIFITAIFIGTSIFLSKLKTELVNKELLLIGFIWLILTVIFEFGFGHYIMGHPWSHLLAEYNIFNGRVWILVLAATTIAPLICGKRKSQL
jgi:hypothetical protein